MGKLRQESLTKSERKLDKKVQFYSKIKDTFASLNAKKSITKKTKLRSRQKKLKAYDLSTLSEFLPDFKSPQQSTPAAEFKLNCKSRKKLLLKEGKQLNIVVDHPAFKSDPFEAIYQHLQSTQPVVEEKAKKKPNKNGSKKVKRKKSNVPSKSSMEF
ncbi:uncharacterized protein LOC126668652 [Mercurialis annua]|uniref:uncharacterized protein LOC126668652 n=1 Tax=Mercurialis annua TaxID=3986 RepID=UPI00215E7E2A|nr:uncharacterized protein LOC126668652 [Mercurialis annua]